MSPNATGSGSHVHSVHAVSKDLETDFLPTRISFPVCTLECDGIKRRKVMTASYIFPYRLLRLLSYLLHGSRGLPEKPTVSELVRKFLAVYGNRRFITTFTTARHLSLSWARLIQSMPSIPLLEDSFWYYPLSTLGSSKFLPYHWQTFFQFKKVSGLYMRKSKIQQNFSEKVTFWNA